MTTELENQMNAGIAAAQRELIQGYYNRIHLQKPTIDEIMEWLQSDLLHVTQEDLLIDANAILNQGLKAKYPLAFDTIKLPVRYHKDSKIIFDSVPNPIVDMIGYGHIQYLDNPEQRQDQIGELIAHLLNQLQ